MTASGSAIARAPRPSSLADVLDLILDKGLVIDAYVRVSAVGIELLTIDARIVIASVDTYLHYAEAVNRLDLTVTETKGVPGLFGDDDSGGGGSDGRRSDGRQELPAGRSQRRRSERPSARQGADGDGEDGRGGSDTDDEDDGRAKGLARRISDKGRWNS